MLGSGIVALRPLSSASSVSLSCPLTPPQTGGGGVREVVKGGCVEVLLTVEAEQIVQVNMILFLCTCTCTVLGYDHILGDYLSGSLRNFLSSFCV